MSNSGVFDVNDIRYLMDYQQWSGVGTLELIQTVTADDSVKEVVVEMCYQLGLAGFSKFKMTISYLEKENYIEASKEMLDSKWAKQTPNRAKKLSKIVESAGQKG